jgi:hypothetical protein
MAACYANQQYLRGSEEAGQAVVLCDGFSGPFDTFVSHIYPFATVSMYEAICTPATPYSRFLSVVVGLIYNLHLTAFTKRFHNIVDCTLWRPDYLATIHYVYGERDLLFDVPFIGGTGEQVHVLPRTGHGGCFFGRQEAVQTIGRMLCRNEPRDE